MSFNRDSLSEWASLIRRRDLRHLTLWLNTPGFDINHKFPGYSNSTLLMAASIKAPPEIVELFIMRGAKVDEVDNYERSALHYAVCVGGGDCVRLLLQHKADVNTKDYEGVTPLCAAVVRGFNEIVKLLLEHKADPSIPRRDGFTPLSIATSDAIKDMLREAIDERKKAEGQQPSEDQPSARRGPR